MIKSLIQYAGWVASFILALILLHQCETKHTENKTIIVPSKEGSFKKDSLIPIIQKKVVYRTIKGDKIIIDHPVDSTLAHNFELLQKQHDSLAIRLKYLDAIGKRTYEGKLEDKYVAIKYHAASTGTIDTLHLDYYIKPDTIPLPKPKSAILLGGGIYNTGARFNLGFQSKSGNISTISYDPLNKRVFLDYTVRVFNIGK